MEKVPAVTFLSEWVIGASLSEPHLDEFAANFLCIYIYIYIYIFIYEGQPHSW